MKVITSFDAYEPWAGAVNLYCALDAIDKLNDLDAVLEECFPEGAETTTINDALWFDQDFILSALGLIEEDENGNYEEYTLEEIVANNLPEEDGFNYHVVPVTARLLSYMHGGKSYSGAEEEALAVEKYINEKYGYKSGQYYFTYKSTKLVEHLATYTSSYCSNSPDYSGKYDNNNNVIRFATIRARVID